MVLARFNVRVVQHVEIGPVFQSGVVRIVVVSTVGLVRSEILVVVFFVAVVSVVRPLAQQIFLHFQIRRAPDLKIRRATLCARFQNREQIFIPEIDVLATPAIGIAD
jgi:hypothetical protein